MTTADTGAWVRKLIADGQLHKFYISPAWERLRREVLREYRGECLWCKERGYYTPADTVHHVQFVRKWPEMALSKHYVYQGKQLRNLIPLCRKCHELAHERKNETKAPVTPERW